MPDQDRAILDSFVDPDKGVDIKYPYDEDFLRMILGTLLCNRYFLTQSTGLIQAHYFRAETHQLFCRLLFNYFEKYKSLPSKIFLKELVDESLQKRYSNQDDKYKTVRLLYFTELNLIYDYYTKGGVGNVMPMLDSPDAILDKITKFAKIQAIKIAFSQSIDLMKRMPEADEIYEKIDEFYKDARLVDRNFDAGLNYFETLEDRYARLLDNNVNTEVFTTGFRPLDNSLMGGGLVRGEMGAWMAKSGCGKSLALTQAAGQNILRGKKVLYISTEMDQDRIATRFDAQMSNIGQHQLMLKKEDVWRALEDSVSDYEDKRRLVIKQFPSGTADMTMVKAYYAQLVSLGFKPDLFILDYPGDMKDYSALQGWDGRFRLLREIRGFGVEEKHCTMIAVHPNRTTAELGIEEFMDENNQGDSFKQFQIFDGFWTLNQTAAENKACVGRAFSAKARNGKSRFSFKIRYHFKDQTLRISDISEGTYKTEMSKTRDDDVDDVSIDKVKFAGGDGEMS